MKLVIFSSNALNVFLLIEYISVFGPKRYDVTEEWRKLHNEDLNVVYSSPNIVRVIKSRRWAGNVAHVGEGRGVYRVLVGKSGGKETTGETQA
jgi:hypothetical protein